MRNVTLLPPEVIELQKEVLKHHPHLIAKYDLQSKPLDETIGALAAEVNITVDGLFTSEEIIELIEKVLERLKARRTIHVAEPRKLILPPGFH